jgi:hypothetical protein
MGQFDPTRIKSLSGFATSWLRVPVYPTRMAVKRIPRPRDPIALAKLVGDIATGQVEDKIDDGKDEAGGATAPANARVSRCAG